MIDALRTQILSVKSVEMIFESVCMRLLHSFNFQLLFNTEKEGERKRYRHSEWDKKQEWQRKSEKKREWNGGNEWKNIAQFVFSKSEIWS